VTKGLAQPYMERLQRLVTVAIEHLEQAMESLFLASQE
jgi:hypothetical protein